MGRVNTQPWEAEELAWARACVMAGDTVEDIAEMSGRSVEDVRRRVPMIRLTNHERTALQLYAAGTTVRDIGRALKPTSTRPDSLGACYVRRLRDKGVILQQRRPGRSPDGEARRYGQA
ncbi:hypothetical protein GVN24_24600 [Rhizobium sp. CRIBSB]|nr:hypothetical protein [Rhizobium sp. CRIBSB]